MLKRKLKRRNNRLLDRLGIYALHMVIELSRITTDRGFVPSNGCNCGSKVPRTKSKKQSASTDSYVSSTHTVPKQSIAAIANILHPLLTI